MPDIRLTLADGTVQDFPNARHVDLPETFVTVETEERVIGVHERHVSRVEMTGVSLTPPGDSPRR